MWSARRTRTSKHLPDTGISLDFDAFDPVTPWFMCFSLRFVWIRRVLLPVWSCTATVLQGTDLPTYCLRFLMILTINRHNSLTTVTDEPRRDSDYDLRMNWCRKPDFRSICRKKSHTCLKMGEFPPFGKLVPSHSTQTAQHNATSHLADVGAGSRSMATLSEGEVLSIHRLCAWYENISQWWWCPIFATSHVDRLESTTFHIARRGPFCSLIGTADQSCYGISTVRWSHNFCCMKDFWRNCCLSGGWHPKWHQVSHRKVRVLR